jgi:hypothetical protein
MGEVDFARILTSPYPLLGKEGDFSDSLEEPESRRLISSSTPPMGDAPWTMAESSDVVAETIRLDPGLRRDDEPQDSLIGLHVQS